MEAASFSFLVKFRG